MEHNTSSAPVVQHLRQLSGYAAFLLHNHLAEYTSVLLQMSRDWKIPILASLEHLSDEELLAMGTENNTLFLQALVDCRIEDYIRETVHRLQTNALPNIENNKLLAADITIGVFLRKQAFLHFLSQYTAKIPEILELVKQIDQFMLAFETAMAEAHAGLLRKRIEDRNLFIETVNNALPGAVYIFDLAAYRNIFATEKLAQIIGYSNEELNALGKGAVASLIHEDDIPSLQEHLDRLTLAEDGVINSYKYRIRQKTGQYRWIRNYETVFKRDETGVVTHSIAIAIDIDKEKSMAEDLKKRESELIEAQKLFKQAQALSHLGHYTLDLKTRVIFLTEEASRIYGFDPGVERFRYEDLTALRHPDDSEKAQRIIQHTLDTHEPFDFHFRIINNKGVEKTIHTLGNILYDENSEATRLVGTIQDVTERHGLLKRLQESENLYKQAQALVHLGNWVIDFETGQCTLSDEMYAIFQMPRRNSFTLSDWEALMHPDDREPVRNYLQECIREKKSYDRQHRLLLADGTIKMLHRKGEFIFTDAGKPVKLVGTTQDVTEQHRVQQELKDNQVFIRKITDATPSIITLHNVHSAAYVFISEGLQKLLGYDTGELMSSGTQGWDELIHPDDAGFAREKNTAAMERTERGEDNIEDVVEWTRRIRHKNGSYRWFHTYSTIFDRNNEGKVDHLLNITLDVSAQVAAEEKIADQELFIRHLADASPTILYIFDVAKNAFDYINKEVFFVLGYSTQDVENMGSDVVAKLYHPEDFPLLPERRESSKHFQHPGSMIQYECRMRTREDEWKWLLVREVVFKTNEAGAPMQVLGAALDISRRKEMERSLLQNSFQLEQSNASLEEFAYVASHDLKEPLRKISTFGDRLVTTQADRLTEEGKIYLNKIVSASQRMQHMINDLLSISLISGDRSFGSFSLQSVLDDALQALEYKIDKLGAVITATPLPQVNIVPSQFRQLFQNLLSNALKFTPPDRAPRINITSKFLSPEEAQEFQIVQAPRYLQLQVSDNGIGFESEYAGKIFQIFQRLHGKSEYEGTGIGLAICKKIVEHHGGVILANGVPDEGATFTIILPA